jgi:hypothetical protein
VAAPQEAEVSVQGQPPVGSSDGRYSQMARRRGWRVLRCCHRTVIAGSSLDGRGAVFEVVGCVYEGCPRLRDKRWRDIVAGPLREYRLARMLFASRVGHPRGVRWQEEIFVSNSCGSRCRSGGRVSVGQANLAFCSESISTLAALKFPVPVSPSWLRDLQGLG